MAHRQIVASAVLALAAIAAAPFAQAGVSFSSLPVVFTVSTNINGQDLSAVPSMTYLQDTLVVSWSLNASYVGKDCDFQKVVVRLCYGAPSSKGRGWRAPNDDLSLSKQCLATAITAQPYMSSCAMNITAPANATATGTMNVTLPSNTTAWMATRETPGAKYFVRVVALNSAAADATPANNAVAYGQSTDPTCNDNLFTVVPYSGITISLDIVVIVLSITSYVLLFGFFFWERQMKKNA